MTSSNQRGAVLTTLGGLGWPLLLGAAASSLFYGLLYQGPLDTAFTRRYFAGHPVSFVATCMFFVGLAALVMKLLNVASQLRWAGRVALPPPPPGGQKVEDCDQLLRHIEQAPLSVRRSYLARRLYEAIQYVRNQGSAARLDEELKYLAETDAVRQQEGYALVRIIIWATPMLGFLGTVVGITRALGDLDPQELATSIQTAMDSLLSGLYIAFDTTALALSLSIVLMFIQFLVDRMENQLLAAVDASCDRQLAGRFQQIGAPSDPHVQTVQRMADAVIQSSENLVRRQTELWRGAMDAADQRWRTLTENSAEQTRASLQQSLDQSLGRFAERLDRTQRAAAEQLQRRWEQWQTALSANARILHEQQAELARQGAVMTQVLQATGDVIQLEKSLNQNLQALAGAKNFEDTVMSLAAAIHLLNSRLGDRADAAPHVDLDRPPSQGRAA